MGIIDTVKDIKRVTIHDIVMIKIGKFVYTYGKDACIISYIFKYKIKLVQNNIYVSAFPRNNLNKIIATLENKKINYIILDKRNSYRTDEKRDNKNLNNYDKYLNKAITYVKRKKKIDDIYNILLKEIENNEIEETIKLVRKVINERGKI